MILSATAMLLPFGLLHAETTTTDTNPPLIQPRLTAPGSAPFHLKAVIFEKDDQENKAKVEMFWESPDRWRRTIESSDITQTLIVNGSKVFEKSEDSYLPLHLQTLITAMVDPQPLLETLRPGDRLETRANGARKTPPFCGNLRGSDAGRMAIVCGLPPYDEMETVAAPGHPVWFADYRKFKGRKVARLLISSPEIGVSWRAVVTELEELKHPDPTLFSIEESTPAEKRTQIAIEPEAELRAQSIGKAEIIWPQVLDGSVVGVASYYVSLDRTGKVRETVVLKSDNERANDSARRQIMNWGFKPVLKDGVPVQVESILTFDLNTREFGPSQPLSNEEVRKLCSNVVEPDIPPGKFASGTRYTLHAAIDHEGNVIEVIAGEGPPELFKPCYEAIKKWKFNPVVENGEPRPYRAEIAFQVP